jgi:hypothetical protein
MQAFLGTVLYFFSGKIKSFFLLAEVKSVLVFIIIFLQFSLTLIAAIDRYFF